MDTAWMGATKDIMYNVWPDVILPGFHAGGLLYFLPMITGDF